MSVGPTCTGDLEVGVHTCMPAHWIGMHGGTGKGVKGVHYVRACRLHSCACVRGCDWTGALGSVPVRAAAHVCVPMNRRA
jgi:hypothetical protein